MTLEEDIEKLKSRIELMRKCYFKGFGNLVFAVYLNCNNYLNEHNEESRTLVLKELDLVEGHYRTLPFEQLESNSEFAPLFVVRTLLLPYGRNARAFLEDPDKERLEEIGARRTAIILTGEVYRDNFNKRLSELRQIPGYEKFRVILKDYKGCQFGM